MVRDTHERLSTSTLGTVAGNSRHTITHDEFLTRSGSGARSTLRRASTLMHKKELSLDLPEEDEEESIRLEDDSDDEKEKSSPNHIPEEPSDEEEE